MVECRTQCARSVILNPFLSTVFNLLLLYCEQDNFVVRLDPMNSGDYLLVDLGSCKQISSLTLHNPSATESYFVPGDYY